MKTGTLFLQEGGSATLTCYLHDDSPEMPNAAVRPAVLVLPGGAYRVCSDREAEPVALAYMAEGFHTFVLRYTVEEGSTFENALADGEKALEIIRQRAEEWNVDPQRIAVAGFSAGGHLAAMLGASGKVRPNALVLGYPCIYAGPEDRILAFSIPEADKTVDANTPPAFLFTTSEDEVIPVDNTLRFANALAASGVPFELHVFQKGGHGLSLARPATSGGVHTGVNAAVAQWFSLSVGWLWALFGHFPADGEPFMAGVLTEYEEYGIDVALRELWANEVCRQLLLEHLPMLEDENARQPAMQVSLRMMAHYAPDWLTDDLLETLDAKLKAIKVVQ